MYLHLIYTGVHIIQIYKIAVKNNEIHVKQYCNKIMKIMQSIFSENSFSYKNEGIT